MKQEFLLSEIWLLTIGAAFGRANVYKNDFDEKQRKDFKQDLRNKVVEISNSYISKSISDEEHIKNIDSITQFSKKYKEQLQGGEFNFGVSQKLLNLYLKYLWCLNILNFPPPHFPVDRRIQKDLGINSPDSWTSSMFDEDKYFKVISKAREALNTDINYNGAKNIAELELDLFKRSMNEKEIVSKLQNIK